MKKLRKLIKTPNLFFRDLFAKRVKSNQKKSKKKSSLEITNIDLNYLPVLALHSGEGLKAGIMHLQAWIPVFLKSEISFLVLVRNDILYNWLKKNQPNLIICFAKGGADIEEFLNKLPSIKTIFYPSSTGNNIHLVRFNYLKHIFIGHGDSDKASSANKALRLYDEIWVAGEAHIDRFRNQGFDINHLQFKKVGRPNSLRVIKESQERVKGESKQQQFLYLPTWEGGVEEANYSSIDYSYDLVTALRDRFKVLVSCKFHPLIGTRKKSLNLIKKKIKEDSSLDNSQIKVIEDNIEITNFIADYDFFICDLSAVVTDCLATGAPIFLYEPIKKNTYKASSNMKYSDFCYTFSDIEELSKKIEQIQLGNDFLAEKRKKAQQYFLGYQETISKKFIREVNELL